MTLYLFQMVIITTIIYLENISTLEDITLINSTVIKF